MIAMMTCEWRPAYSHAQLIEYKIARGDRPLLIPPAYIPIHHGQLRRNYNPSADPAFDKAPFTGEEKSHADHVVDIVDADTSAKITVQEDRDVERTDSHEQPPKCTRTPNVILYCIHMGHNEGLFAVEVGSLLSDVREDERGVSRDTRGKKKKVDAYKQEHALDRATGLGEDLL